MSRHRITIAIDFDDPRDLEIAQAHVCDALDRARLIARQHPRGPTARAAVVLEAIAEAIADAPIVATEHEPE